MCGWPGGQGCSQASQHPATASGSSLPGFSPRESDINVAILLHPPIWSQMEWRTQPGGGKRGEGEGKGGKGGGNNHSKPHRP